jgi:hypothetical protein
MIAGDTTIRLAAIFEPGKRIKPVWFELNHRKHTILQTTYAWKNRVGDVTFLHFTVTDGEALYELVFNAAEQSWTLNALQTE